MQTVPKKPTNLSITRAKQGLSKEQQQQMGQKEEEKKQEIVIAPDSTPDIIKYDFIEIDQRELMKIWDPLQNPALQKQQEQ